MVNQKGETLVYIPSSEEQNSIAATSQHSSEIAMDDYLNTIGLYRKPVAKDGSCLFRVVAEQVYQSQARHLDVRKQCIKFMKENKELFQGFVEGSFEHHVFNLENPKEWAGQVEIFALSLLYKRDFIVYQSVNSLPTEVTNNGFKEKIFLCYSNGNHYDCIYPKQFKEDASMVQALLFEHLYTTVFPEIEERELKMSRDNEDSGFVDGFPNGWTEVKSKTGKGKPGEETTPTLSQMDQSLHWEKTRSLDPTVYRNIELEVWDQTRHDQQLCDRHLAAQCQFQIGDVCLASLKKVSSSVGLHKVKIEDIVADQSIYLVTVLDTNQKFHVALEDLQPVTDSEDATSYRDLPGYYRKSETAAKDNDFQKSKRRVRPGRKGNGNEDGVQNEDGRGHISQRKGKEGNFRNESGRKGSGVSSTNQPPRNKVSAGDRQREDENRPRGVNKRGPPHGSAGSVAPRVSGENFVREEDTKQGVKRDPYSSNIKGRNQGDGPSRRDRRATPEGKSYKRDRNQFERKSKGVGETSKRDESSTQGAAETPVDGQREKSSLKEATSPVDMPALKTDSSVEDADDNTDESGEKGKPVKVKQTFETPADFYSRMRKKQTSSTPGKHAKQGLPDSPTVPQGGLPNIGATASGNISSEQNVTKMDNAIAGRQSGDGMVMNEQREAIEVKDDVASQEPTVGGKKDVSANQYNTVQDDVSRDEKSPVMKSREWTVNATGVASKENSAAAVFDSVTDLSGIARPKDPIVVPVAHASPTVVPLDERPLQTEAGQCLYAQKDVYLPENNSDNILKTDPLHVVDDMDNGSVEGLPDEMTTFDSQRDLESPLSFMDTDCLETDVSPVYDANLPPSTHHTPQEVDLSASSTDVNNRAYQKSDDIATVEISTAHLVLEDEEKPANLMPAASKGEDGNSVHMRETLEAADQISPNEEQFDKKPGVVDYQANLTGSSFTKSSIPEHKIRILRKHEKLSDVEAKGTNDSLRPTFETDLSAQTPSPVEDTDKQAVGMATANEGNKEKKAKKVSFGEVKFSDCASNLSDVRTTSNLLPMSEMDSIANQPPCQPMTSATTINGPVPIPMSGIPGVPCQGGYGPPLPMIPTSIQIPPEGRDLPEDRNTLRFFYNLGVQYFYMCQHQMAPGYHGIPIPAPVPTPIPQTSLPHYVPNSEAVNIVTESHLNRMAPAFHPQSAMNQRLHNQPHRYNQQQQYQPQPHKMQSMQYPQNIQSLHGGPPYTQQKFAQDNSPLQTKEVPPRFRQRRVQQSSTFRVSQENNQQRQNRRGPLNVGEQSGGMSSKNTTPYR